MVYRLSSTPYSRIFVRSCTSSRTRPPRDWPTLSLKKFLYAHQCRTFHSTPRNQGGPLVPIFAVLLKASSSIEFARTASRIALTFVPVILLKNNRSRSWLKSNESDGAPGVAERRPVVMRRLRNRERLFRLLIWTPVVLFWATLVASLERTPLTGRWRLILLSPEEEDQISEQLAGPGWYQAVSEILTTQCDPGEPPNIIPPDDWRYTWVQNTLRRLESGIPILQDEYSLVPNWLDVGPDEIQLPPPAEFPLRPRPRASDYLRRFSNMTCGKATHRSPHVVTGPPYSLLLVDRPDASNAFSYGFGPNGGGGVVLFSGFLDEIIKNAPTSGGTPPQARSEEVSWWSYIFGSVSPISSRHSHITPTPEQTEQLAILLAHELSHLVLSHHLESLSAGSVIIPGVVSIVTDLVRTLLFPVTMLFGPFVNDAVANLGKVGSGEVLKVTMLCSSRGQEVEADVVSTRLLAYAGFDPNSAVRFWENRQDMSETAECGAVKKKSPITEGGEDGKREANRSIFKLWGGTHPINKARVDILKGEMERWKTERMFVLSGLPAPVDYDDVEPLTNLI